MPSFWAVFFIFGLDTPGPQFREISRGRGRRSPLDRSQGPRPPWAHTLSHGEARKPGGAVAPAGRSFGRRRTPRVGGCGARGGGGRRLAGTRGQSAGAHRGKAGLPGAKAGGCAGKRRTAGRVSGGIRVAAPGGSRENRASAGLCRGLLARFSRRKAGSTGRKRRHFGAEGGKKGGKSPPHGGLRAENGAQHDVFRTACDGFTLTAHCTGSDPRASTFRAHIGRNSPAVQIGQNVRKMIVLFIGLAFPGLQSDVCVTRRSRPGRGAHPHESTEKEKHP